MIRALFALALAPLLACDDSNTCSLIEYTDGFSIVISSDTWAPEDYRIITSWEEDGGTRAHVCDVSVPVYSWDGALDADVRNVRAQDGGTSGPLGTCRLVQGASTTGEVSGTVWVGRALVLSLPGTPERVKVEIDTPRGRVLETELELDYSTEYPQGRGCGGPTTASARVALP